MKKNEFTFFILTHKYGLMLLSYFQTHFFFSSENRTQLPNSGTSHDRPVVMKKIVTGQFVGLYHGKLYYRQVYSLLSLSLLYDIVIFKSIYMQACLQFSGSIM